MNIIIWINLLYRLISVLLFQCLLKATFYSIQNNLFNILFVSTSEIDIKVGNNIWI